MNRVGILAGGGRLPLMVAESVTAHGGVVHIVGIEGEADPAIAGFPHTWVNWGEIGRMIAALRREGGGQVVIAGAVTRPDLTRVRPDAGLLRNLPLIARLLAGGDDAVLTRVVRFLEDNGLQVHGVHEVAPDLLVGSGPLGANTLGTLDCVDAELGFAVRQALGAVDAGQAVVVVRGRVLAIEGAEGTDAMLQRAAELASGGGQSGPAGVLTKGPKPGQEMRVDMPVVGPRTVAQAAAAGLAGVAVEAAAVLVLDRPEAIGVADARGLAVQGFPALPCGASRARAAPQPVRTARVLGRVRPRRRDVVDIETGLAGVWALAPFATGFGAVVLRRYILAIEAAEGTQAMLTRAAALRRQWGLRRRKAGVLVRRVPGAAGDRDAIEAVLAQTASMEAAGLAVTGPADALAPYEEAAWLADRHGLFLVLCEAP